MREIGAKIRQYLKRTHTTTLAQNDCQIDCGINYETSCAILNTNRTSRRPKLTHKHAALNAYAEVGTEEDESDPALMQTRQRDIRHRQTQQRNMPQATSCEAIPVLAMLLITKIFQLRQRKRSHIRKRKRQRKPAHKERTTNKRNYVSCEGIDRRALRRQVRWRNRKIRKQLRNKEQLRMIEANIREITRRKAYRKKAKERSRQTEAEEQKGGATINKRGKETENIPRAADDERRGGATNNTRRGEPSKYKLNTQKGSSESRFITETGGPKQTWGDGSCWLWAVAAALGKLEGINKPTRRDLSLEKKWREEVYSEVTNQNMEMLSGEKERIKRGVTYIGDTNEYIPAAWGGGTELQALAAAKNINVCIWDKRYIGGAGKTHINWCKPDSTVQKITATQARSLEEIRDNITVHVLYNGYNHYEYFERVNTRGQEGDNHGERIAEEKYNTQDKKYNTQSSQATEIVDSSTKEDEKKPDHRKTEKKGHNISITEREIKGKGDEWRKETAGTSGLAAEIKMATLNISGISYGLRKEHLKTKDEILKVKPGDKLREIKELLRTQNIKVAALTDTHAIEKDMYQIGNYLRQEGLQGGGIPAILEGQTGEVYKRKRQGIYFVWDPIHVKVQKIETIEIGRVARADIELLHIGVHISIYAVYMPVRGADGKKAQEIWRRIREDTEDRKHNKYIIMGDFNAEPTEWRQAHGRQQTEEDRIFVNNVEDMDLAMGITEDYTFERGKSLIDNILIPVTQLTNVASTFVTTGVTEKDHKMLIIQMEWRFTGKTGQQRPQLRYTNTFQPKHWAAYEQALESGRETLMERVQNASPPNKLHHIQEYLQSTAAAIAGKRHPPQADREREGREHTCTEEIQELNKEEREREKARARAYKWKRHLHDARRYAGGKGKDGGFWRRKEIYSDHIMSRLEKDNRKARRARVIKICETEAEKAETELGKKRGEVKKGEALVKSLMRLGTSKGDIVIRVFDTIKKATEHGGRPQGGIAGMYKGDQKGAEVIRGPEIIQEVREVAQEINDTKKSDVETVRKLLNWAQINEEGAYTAVSREEYINAMATPENAEQAIDRMHPNKGLGIDGFDGYLVKRAGRKIQELYHEVIKDILISQEYPETWNQWIAILMVKPGEDPFELHRRRDIWLQCHSLKYACRLMEGEYMEAANKGVPNTQAGWTKDRMATEHSLTVRIIEETCELQRSPCIKGYVDMGCFFMSVRHDVQWMIEDSMGISEHIIATMRALREGTDTIQGLQGKYETAYGLTEPVDIKKGLGQGDLLSPVRSKLILAVIQKAMQTLVPGISLASVTKRNAPFLIYADDGIIIVDSVQTLQLAMDVLWVLTKILGLTMQVKGKKKTAWSGVYYLKDGTELDIQGWAIKLPDGTEIPQLTGIETYRYLGTHLRTGRAKGNAIKQMRKIIIGKAKRIIYAIGRLPALTQGQLGNVIALGIAGVLGYYARSTPMDMASCKNIEEARIQVLKAAGYTTGIPRGQVYQGSQTGGMEKQEHAYGIAAAAYCDQIDRALCGASRADHATVSEALAETCYRLGCRGCSPLEWDPVHLREDLDETRVIEAYIKYKITIGIGGQRTKGDIHGALDNKKWCEKPATPRMWEEDEIKTQSGTIKTESIVFHRALAEMGIAEWADIYDINTGTYYTMSCLAHRYGYTKLTARQKMEYSNLKRLHGLVLRRGAQGMMNDIWEGVKTEKLQEAEKQWQRKHENQGEGKATIVNVTGRRKTAECWGEEEYRIKWQNGEEEWIQIDRIQHMNSTNAQFIERNKAGAAYITNFTEYLIMEGRGVEGLQQEGNKEEWGEVWEEFLKYIETTGTKREATYNTGTEPAKNVRKITREAHATLYPGEVEGEKEKGKNHRQRGAGDLSYRARNNQQKAENRNATHREKRERLANNTDGTRKPSLQPGKQKEGKEWHVPDIIIDEEARQHMGGENKSGTYDLYKGTKGTKSYDVAHNKNLTQHPILRLFLRPEEAENGKAYKVREEDKKLMTEGAKITGEVMEIAMTLHERHNFHAAVATDGAKGGSEHKNINETIQISKTTYATWEGPKASDILDQKRATATIIQKRMAWDQELTEREKIEATRNGGMEGRIGDSATSAEAELYAIFAAMKRAQAEQEMGKYGGDKARVLILSDCLSGITKIERCWRADAPIFRNMNNGAILEAIVNVRETLGTVIFVWVPSHVGIVPNTIADNIATKAGTTEAGGVTQLISKQITSRPTIYTRKINDVTEFADDPVYKEVRKRTKTYIRKIHPPTEAGECCEPDVARNLLKRQAKDKEEEDLEQLQGQRDLEKFIYGMRNAEIVSGPADERRLRHATEGEKKNPTYWTYIKENGCRVCGGKTNEKKRETIHHVISGGCEAMGRKQNVIYRREIKRTLTKIKEIYEAGQRTEGIRQVSEALQAIGPAGGRHEENATTRQRSSLRDTLTGIVPQWTEPDTRKKKSEIALVTMWTENAMATAMAHMGEWQNLLKGRKHIVQNRWDNRHSVRKYFQTWKHRAGHPHNGEAANTGEAESREKKEKDWYGLKYWGRRRTLPSLSEKARIFLKQGVG